MKLLQANYHELGDKVWLIHYSLPVKGEITKISLVIDHEGQKPDFVYTVKIAKLGRTTVEMNGFSLFKSTEELLEYIIEEIKYINNE